jgi:hypothetical protein
MRNLPALQTSRTQMRMQEDWLDHGGIISNPNFTAFGVDLNLLNAIQINGLPGTFLPITPIDAVNPK